MNQQALWQLLADVVLTVHVAIVLFVVGGLVAIVAGNLAGNPAGLRWVNALWFRVLHLVAIAVVVMEAWLGIECPSTTLEAWLRVRAGAEAYDESFIQHWLQRLLFYQAPGWVFVVAYSLFGLLVAAAWWYFPPQRRSRRRRRSGPQGDRTREAQ